MAVKWRFVILNDLVVMVVLMVVKIAKADGKTSTNDLDSVNYFLQGK